MRYTFIKDMCKTIFTQNSDGTCNIEDHAYLTCRKAWWYTGTRYNCPALEADEIMTRLSRKGYAVFNR